MPAWFLVALTLFAQAPSPPDNAPASSLEAGLQLLREGDELADAGKTTDAEIRYQQAMELLLPRLRGLPFKHPVRRDVTPRDQIRSYLLKKLEEDATPEERRAEELSLKAFGLIPRDLNYEELLLRVYTDEVGAFYDPKTDTMHLILEPEGGRKPGLLEALLGRKPGFDKEESKTIIAHELTHALADQHYQLERFMDAVNHDDDRALALSALIEGEATLVMLGASSGDWSGKETAKLPAEALGRVFSLLAPFLPIAGSASLRTAPPIIRDSLLFPYLRGVVFCARQVNAHGWPALDQAYASPPLSTEQILHPDKYGPDGDPPTDFDLGTLDPGPEWTELERDVLGEFQIAILLRSHDGKNAAAGWDGDRYATYENAHGQLGLVWITTWDSPDEARQFARALGQYQARRNPDDRGDYLILDSGPDVALVQGFDPETNHRLAERILQSPRFEKQFTPPNAP
ncbi:MAG: hypothetical protein KatS3mg108_3219 [Isosphaeraceae bacterium]|jgi:hypothetical protein|nr:MAG: hypothetical protein KatS3mg108_3219 [Isosphaeraceae bacterium]